jgi:hypothetical protein
MNGEAIQEVERLVVKGFEPREFDADPKGFYALENGMLQRHQFPLQPLEHTVHDLDSLTRLLKADPKAQRAVFVSTSRVVASAEDEDVRDQYVMNLPQHEAFKTVLHHLEARRYAQRDLVKLLRTKLSGFVDPMLVETIRNLKTNASMDGESVVQSGMESLSRNMVAQVKAKNGNALPEEFIVTVPVFDVPETRRSFENITILLEATPDDKGNPTFELTAVRNDTSDAVDSAMEKLVIAITRTPAWEELQKAKVEIFRAAVTQP